MVLPYGGVSLMPRVHIWGRNAFFLSTQRIQDACIVASSVTSSSERALAAGADDVNEIVCMTVDETHSQQSSVHKMLVGHTQQ